MKRGKSARVQNSSNQIASIYLCIKSKTKNFIINVIHVHTTTMFCA